MKRIIQVITLALGIFSATGLISCKKAETAAVAQKTQPVNVTVQQIKPAQLIDGIQVTGTVKAFEDVMMSPEEGGHRQGMEEETGRPGEAGGTHRSAEG